MAQVGFAVELLGSLSMAGIVFILVMIPVVLYLVLSYSPWDFNLGLEEEGH